MDVQFHCVIEKASVEEEKISFSHTASYDAVLIPISQGTEVTIVTEYVLCLHLITSKI